MNPGQDPRVDLTPTLVGRLREGSETAGRMLEELYRGRLVRFCQGYVGSMSEAEDIVQDVFLRVHASDVVPDDFRAWIYRISRNRCLDVVRSRKRRRDDASLPEDSPLGSGAIGELTHLIRSEDASRCAGGRTPSDGAAHAVGADTRVRRKTEEPLPRGRGSGPMQSVGT